MAASSQQHKNLVCKILKKSHPDIHNSIVIELQRANSFEKLKQVAEIKKVFEKQGIEDKRRCIANKIQSNINAIDAMKFEVI